MSPSCSYACTCSNSASFSPSASSFQCAACAPAAVTGATAVSTGSWNYRYDCNAGYYGVSTVRTCSATAGTFTGTDVNCTVCVPPVAPGNATGPTLLTAGTWRYLCKPGYYGSPGQVDRCVGPHTHVCVLIEVHIWFARTPASYGQYQPTTVFAQSLLENDCHTDLLPFASCVQ
jgi:hypothetical protein